MSFETWGVGCEGESSLLTIYWFVFCLFMCEYKEGIASFLISLLNTVHKYCVLI